MAKIEIYFGHPQDEKHWDGVENCSYNQDINIETAVIRGFKSVNSVLIRQNEQNDNYFELVVMSLTGQLYKFPKITTGVYKERGFVFPKLVINGDILKNKKTGNRIFLCDELIESIGKDFDNDFDYEYFGFKRFGKATLLKSEVIYKLRNKPHIYHKGKFIEVKNC
jgi:hypothetical protein